MVFRLRGNDGLLGASQRQIAVVSDATGRAQVTFSLGTRAGVGHQVVEASAVGFAGPAVFLASALPGEPELVVADAGSLQVGVAGRQVPRPLIAAVVDSGRNRLEGVPLRFQVVKGQGHFADGSQETVVATDSDGRAIVSYVLDSAEGIGNNAVSASIVGLEDAYSASFVASSRAAGEGRDNTINMPIFLLPLDLENAVYVDETRGGTLTLPQIPGFALDVTPGSVTFPGGGRSGLVSVTVVHNDKVPMIPNFGQQPRLIVTIQPAGARFDPPARLTLPNVDGLAPGKVTEMYSFDHDLGHFVSIGSATVSDDATVVTSDPGVGIVKAGWHCGSDPVTGVCLHECPECEKCTDPPCRCDPEELCSDCSPPGSACDGEGKCKTGRQLIPKICDGLGQTEEDKKVLNCEEIPYLEGVDGLCGAAVRVTYVNITHDCDSVDLKGASWHEEVTTDGACGGDLGVRTSGTEVLAGNKLATEPEVFRDYYWVCLPIETLPINIACDEVLTQKIFIDDCEIATHKITISLARVVNDDGSEECLGDGVRN